MLKRLTCVSALLMCAGCGSIGVQITGTPNNPQAGQPVNFQITLTNHGLCPTDSVVGLVPFATDQQIISTADGEGAALIQLICNGQISSGPEQCTLSGDIITCNFPVPVGPQAPTQQNFLFSPPGLPEPIPCTQTGGTIQCQIPAADQQAFSFPSLRAQISQASPKGPASCVPLPVPPFSLACLVPPLNAGEMTTIDVALNSPLPRGTYRTLAFVEQTDGVCQGGPTPGQACNTSDINPCGSGGTCQTSICTAGTNTGSGCTVDGDCTGGGTGSCQPCFTQGTNTVITPVGCATTIVGGAEVPTTSRTGLLMVTVALFGLGAFLLRQRQRRPN